MLEITPEVTAILDDFISVNNKRGKKDELSAEEASARGIEVIKEFIDMIVVRRYDGVVRILAAIYEISTEEVEKKTLAEIVAMLKETLADELIISFFPRLKPLAQKMQSDT